MVLKSSCLTAHPRVAVKKLVHKEKIDHNFLALIDSTLRFDLPNYGLDLSDIFKKGYRSGLGGVGRWGGECCNTWLHAYMVCIQFQQCHCRIRILGPH